MNENEAIEIIAKGMGLLEGMKFGPRGDHEVIFAARRVAAVIGSMSWQPDDIKAATKRVIDTMDEYPSAHQFKDCLQWAIDRRKQAEVSKYILCVDSDGTMMFADPRRVRDGVLLPAGDFSGNGLALVDPARALPVSDSIQAIPAELRQELKGSKFKVVEAEATITQEDLDRRDEQIRKLREA